MASSLVQFRADESMKSKASEICEQLGIDLATYLRMCMSRLVQDKGVPFSMKLEDNKGERAIAAMRQASRISEENGISDMSLEEINAEIAAARASRV